MKTQLIQIIKTLKQKSVKTFSLKFLSLQLQLSPTQLEPIVDQLTVKFQFTKYYRIDNPDNIGEVLNFKHKANIKYDRPYESKETGDEFYFYPNQPLTIIYQFN